MMQKENGKLNSTVVLLKSSATDASQISESEVRQMVRNAVERTGGLSDIIKDGQSVVLKPNLVTPRVTPGTYHTMKMLITNPYKDKKHLFQREVNGITTDWRITKAMVEIVREVNPSGKVYVMESSADGQSAKNFELMGYTHDNMPGVDAFISLDETGDDFRSVDSSDLVGVDLGDKALYNKLPGFLKNKYYFDKTYYNADVIISLPCLKNHFMAATTGGIKNVAIGAMPGKIYGLFKNNINRVMTIDHQWDPINKFIHDFYVAKPAHFVLTDGLQGSAYGPHGIGAPSTEAPKMNMRLLLASKDPVACDSIHACIIGVDPAKVDYLTYVQKDCGGVMDTSRITVVGNARVDEVKKRFPFPKGLFGFVYKEPPKKRYTDYDAPELSIDNISVIENQLLVKLRTDSKTNKIEMHIDGKRVKTFTHGFDQLQFSLNGNMLESVNDITFYAYDKFLNCGFKKVTAETLTL